MAFTTKKSLLARVRGGDEISWQEFYYAYKPLILLCGGDCGLTDDEKDELVQNVMCDIFQKDIIGKFDPDKIPENIVFKYDPEKGRFRHYLRKIVHNQAIGIYRKRCKKELFDSDDDTLDNLPSQNNWETAWEEEWHKHVLNMAMTELKNRVQSDTFAAFEMYAVQNRKVEEVADFLNLSVSSVYTAKSRCITALKEIVRELDEK